MLDQPTDAQAVIDVAQAAVPPTPLEVGKVHSLVVPAGGAHHVIDLERYAPVPQRARGTYILATVEAFIAYVGVHDADVATTVWVDISGSQVQVVFDDHGPEMPGWGEHRAILPLRATPEWRHWTSKDGTTLSQEAFAEHVEEGLTEIVAPDAADMLEIAQSISATSTANFRSARRLHDGRVQMVYDEDVDAKAGASGEFEVPREFVLSIAPFYGEEPREVRARLRFRVNGGKLTIGYRLDRPEAVVRGALQGIADRLGEKFSRVYLGTPRS